MKINHSIENRVVKLENIVKCLYEQIQECCSEPICISPFISTHPQNITVSEGSLASLYVIASGTAPLSYQWYKGEVLIDGATSNSYSIDDVPTHASGNYSVVVHNNCGEITSNVASIDVIPESVSFTAYWGWFETDPYETLLDEDILTYQGNGTFTHNGNVIADYRAAYSQRYYVMKIPVNQSIKTLYYNSPFINGVIPDATWRTPFTNGSFRYYLTRDAVDFDITQLTTFS